MALVTIDHELIVCGYNKDGQLGIGHNRNLSKPQYNDYITEQIDKVACGVNHTLVLTK